MRFEGIVSSIEEGFLWVWCLIYCGLKMQGVKGNEVENMEGV